MIEEAYLRRGLSIVIVLGLIVLSYILLKPILMSLITGVILASIFVPVFKKLNKKIKNKSAVSLILTILLILLIVIPSWILIPILLNESISIFRATQSLDLVTPVKAAFPSLFSNEEVASELARSLQNFAQDITGNLMNSVAGFLLEEFPNLVLYMTVILFSFFFVLRDHEQLIRYVKGISPFPKEIDKKLFKSTKDITNSVLYGQFVIGMLQGVLVGVGFFIFGVPNALFLTILAVIAGIFPVIGATIIWVPLVIYLFFTGWSLWPLFGIIAFGVAGSFFENSTKPAMVSRKTNVHSGVILFGMIGGLIVFGIMGFVIGPLVLAYLLIFFDIIRDKGAPSIFEIKK